MKANASEHIKTEVNHRMTIREWVLIFVLSLIWGASFFFVEVAVVTMTPFTIVMVRVGMAAAALWGFVLATGRRMPSSPGIWAGLIALGAMNNVLPFSLITWGQTIIESGLASILNAFSPVFSALLAHFLTREERLTPNRLVGVAFGWIGVAILIGVTSLSGDSRAAIAQVAVLGAALLYAFAAIFGRRFKDLDPVVVAAGMLTGSTLIMIPLTFALEQPFGLEPTALTWAALVCLALVSTALAYIIYFYVLARAGATNILLVTFLIPVSAIFLGAVILGESLSWNAFAGMAMIFAGLAAIDGRVFNWIKKR
ncbi:MAG: DMT family transporter [Desulfobacterales bacterium]|nr:DMT family transporter [Desulfobacterales bacterium]